MSALFEDDRLDKWIGSNVKKPSTLWRIDMGEEAILPSSSQAEQRSRNR